MEKTTLLIIDPQYDFCSPTGALCVPGAHMDMLRLSEFITHKGNKITDIHVTLDTHNLIDVAHPLMWVDEKGNNPKPFTIITLDDVQSGKWAPFDAAYNYWLFEYVKALDDTGASPLCIWPPHCLIGSPGAAVYSDVHAALNLWTARTGKNVVYHIKGRNIFTEHYSAIRAEVEYSFDKETQTNWELIDQLSQSDRVLVAGEASSHCVASTVDDLAALGVHRVLLLTDCMSPVPSFENKQAEFFKSAELSGYGLVESTKI